MSKAWISNYLAVSAQGPLITDLQIGSKWTGIYVGWSKTSQIVIISDEHFWKILSNVRLWTLNEGINQRYLRNWADVADRICFGCTYKFGIGIEFSAVHWSLSPLWASVARGWSLNSNNILLIFLPSVTRGPWSARPKS